MSKPKVLVTGASGYIASLILPALRERYELTLVDVRSTDRNGQELPGIPLFNLIDKNRDAYRHLFKDVDAVVHLGFTRPQDSNYRIANRHTSISKTTNTTRSTFRTKTIRSLNVLRHHRKSLHFDTGNSLQR